MLTISGKIERSAERIVLSGNAQKTTRFMSNLFSESSSRRASLNGVDARPQRNAGDVPASLHELIHQVRQPLSVIECLTYYLELTSADEKACAQMSRIRAMVSQVNGILERACDSERNAAATREAVAC